MMELKANVIYCTSVKIALSISFSPLHDYLQLDDSNNFLLLLGLLLGILFFGVRSLFLLSANQKTHKGAFQICQWSWLNYKWEPLSVFWAPSIWKAFPSEQLDTLHLAYPFCSKNCTLGYLVGYGIKANSIFISLKNLTQRCYTLIQSSSCHSDNIK